MWSNTRTTRDLYQPIAMQAAVMFEVACAMIHINPLYQITIDQFLSYYHVAIKQSDRQVSLFYY